MKSELIPRGEKEAGCEPPLRRRAKEDWDGNLEGRLKPELPTGKSQAGTEMTSREHMRLGGAAVKGICCKGDCTSRPVQQVQQGK